MTGAQTVLLPSFPSFAALAVGHIGYWEVLLPILVCRREERTGLEVEVLAVGKRDGPPASRTLAAVVRQYKSARLAQPRLRRSLEGTGMVPRADGVGEDCSHQCCVGCRFWIGAPQAYGRSTAPRSKAWHVSQAECHACSWFLHKFGLALAGVCRCCRTAPESVVLGEWFPAVASAIGQPAWQTS